jgi:glycosyltransferase involved in cell wall biosynthesis
MIKILYDGWPLVWAPNSPEALHLFSLLQEHHPEVQALVALPGDPPPWLPLGAQAQVHPTADAPRVRLEWEQRSLPHLASALDADLLHLTASHPPLLGKASSVVSPAEYPSHDSPAGLIPRVRDALARGGMTRLRGLLWPSDLQTVLPLEKSDQVYYLPFTPFPTAGALRKQDNSKLEALKLPDTYILYHGPGDLQSLRRLLDAWSWAAGPVGEYFPLLILGLDHAGQQRLQSLLANSDLAKTVRLLPVLDPTTIACLYQDSYAVFHPARLSAWGTAGRLSLFYGKPLVAAESPLADALAGPAAYLLPEYDARALGAGLLSVIVEELLYQELAQAGRQRASAWDQRSFRDELFAAYKTILTEG